MPLSHGIFSRSLASTCVIVYDECFADKSTEAHNKTHTLSNGNNDGSKQIMMMISTNSSLHIPTMHSSSIKNIQCECSLISNSSVAIFAFEIIYSFYNCLFCAIKHYFIFFTRFLVLTLSLSLHLTHIRKKVK